MRKKLWFKAKSYGYGWYPCSLEGWIVTGLYVLSVLFVFRIADLQSYSLDDILISIIIPFLILSGVLIAICIKTGEKARLRWGN